MCRSFYLQQLSFSELFGKADAWCVALPIKGISIVAQKLGLSEVVKGGGYRSLVNVGENGGQEVPHLHFHIFAGEKIGKMVI